jgi:death-on-curing protein
VAADPFFLDLRDVVRVHVDQIVRYGGRGGIRDLRLLESAIAMSRASFGCEWLHRDLCEMAAAYGFHLSQDHPFFDGNKRTALACALVFLRLNGISLDDPEYRLYDAMMDVARRDLDKYGLARVFGTLEQDQPH